MKTSINSQTHLHLVAHRSRVENVPVGREDRLCIGRKLADGTIVFERWLMLSVAEEMRMMAQVNALPADRCKPRMIRAGVQS